MTELPREITRYFQVLCHRPSLACEVPFWHSNSTNTSTAEPFGTRRQQYYFLGKRPERTIQNNVLEIPCGDKTEVTELQSNCPASKYICMFPSSIFVFWKGVCNFLITLTLFRLPVITIIPSIRHLCWKKHPNPQKEPYVPHFLAVISTFAAFAGLNSKRGNIIFLLSNGFHVCLDNSLLSSLTSPHWLFFLYVSSWSSIKNQKKTGKLMTIKSEISHR